MLQIKLASKAVSRMILMKIIPVDAVYWNFVAYSGSNPSMNVNLDASFKPVPGVRRSNPIP